MVISLKSTVMIPTGNRHNRWKGVEAYQNLQSVPIPYDISNKNSHFTRMTLFYIFIFSHYHSHFPSIASTIFLAKQSNKNFYNGFLPQLIVRCTCIVCIIVSIQAYRYVQRKSVCEREIAVTCLILFITHLTVPSILVS